MSAKSIKIAEMDFKLLKDEMVRHFSQNSIFKDYNFTGSGLNLLLEILAYNSSYNAFLANRAVSESFIDSAQKRFSVVSIAKTLGYNPRSLSVPSAMVSVEIMNATSKEKSFTMPKGTLFTGAHPVNQSKTFSFWNIDPVVIHPDASGKWKFNNIKIYQGQRFREIVRYNENKPYFIIKNVNADLNTLRVTMVNTKEEFTKLSPEKGILEVYRDSMVYFIEELYDGTYKLSFGDGVIGKRLATNDEIEIDYLFLPSNTEFYNGISSFTTNFKGPGLRSSVLTISPSSGGAPKESIESIRTQAPRHYGAQNRAVTTNDYRHIVESTFPFVRAANVWGGEEIDQYGKVFICALPETGLNKLTTAEKKEVTDFLRKNYCVASVMPVIVDPEILTIRSDIKLFVDGMKNTSTDDAIKDSVKEIVKNYNDTINRFDVKFSETDLIDLLQKSIFGLSHAEMTFMISKDVPIFANFNATTDIDLSTPFYHPFDGYGKIKDGVMRSSQFVSFKMPSVRLALNDDGEGGIRGFYADSAGTKRYYLNYLLGSINYDKGTIVLSNLEPISDTIVNIQIQPRYGYIQAFRNKILRSDYENLQISIFKV